MKWLWYQVSVLETSLIKVEGNLLCTYDLLNNKYIHGTCDYFRFNYFSPLCICVLVCESLRVQNSISLVEA